LLKIAIVNLETLHRRKLTGQNVEDFRIKLKRANENCDASGGQHRNTTPHQRASLGYGSGDEITDAHKNEPPLNTNPRQDANVVTRIGDPGLFV
jgi:hypothetical protein